MSEFQSSLYRDTCGRSVCLYRKAGSSAFIVNAVWQRLNRKIAACDRCPRLTAYCREIAVTKRAAYRDQDYWGRPVPNLGVADARLLIVGLAPGAHGANRTGRMFTGDRSGDWLFRALHRAGFASQSESTSADDGLTLVDCAITAACHCAPPDNKPASAELAECADWFAEILQLLPVRVMVALGGIAWNATWKQMKSDSGADLLLGRTPVFGHGTVVQLTRTITLLGSYHPSQQNTFTGRLTEEMLDDVFSTARAILAEER